MQCTMKSPLRRAAFLLEHIDEHDVYHCLHKNVCSVRPYIVDALHPTCVVVVLHHSELKPEGVTQGDGRAVGLVLQLMGETLQIVHDLTVDLIAIVTGEKIQLADGQSVFHRIVVYGHEKLHELV